MDMPSNFPVALRFTKQASGLYTLRGVTTSPDKCHVAERAYVGTIYGVDVPPDLVHVVLPMHTRGACGPGPVTLLHAVTNLRLAPLARTGKKGVFAIQVVNPGRAVIGTVTLLLPVPRR